MMIWWVFYDDLAYSVHLRGYYTIAVARFLSGFSLLRLWCRCDCSFTQFGSWHSCTEKKRPHVRFLMHWNHWTWFPYWIFSTAMILPWIELALWTATSFGKVLDLAAQQSSTRKIREHVKVRRQRPACLFSIVSCSIRFLCNNTYYIYHYVWLDPV